MTTVEPAGGKAWVLASHGGPMGSSISLSSYPDEQEARTPQLPVAKKLQGPTPLC